MGEARNIPGDEGAALLAESDALHGAPFGKELPPPSEKSTFKNSPMGWGARDQCGGSTRWRPPVRVVFRFGSVGVNIGETKRVSFLPPCVNTPVIPPHARPP